MKRSIETAGAVRQKDIAQRLGLSTATVSLALRGAENIAPATRRQVLAVAKELGYQSSSLASVQDLVPAPTTITFAIPRYSVADQFYERVLVGVELEAKSQGMNLRYSHLDDDPATTCMSLSGSDGVLLVGSTPRSFVEYVVAQYPITVLVDNDLPDLNVDRVLTENCGSMMKTVDRLRALGHSRIAFVQGPEWHPSLRARWDGYRVAMERANLEPVSIQHDGERGIDELPDWLSQFSPDVATVLICFNDHLAIRAMRLAESFDIAIPDDLSIVGFDGVDVGQIVRPTLATSVVQRQMMGRESVRMLRRRLTDTAAVPLAMTIDTVWIDGSSLASPRN